MKEKSTFRAKPFAGKLVVTATTSIFPLSFQAVRKLLPFVRGEAGALIGGGGGGGVYILIYSSSVRLISFEIRISGRA